jgi:DNA-binding transcriptional LysR family regulator
MITIDGKYTEARVFTDELEDLARTQIRDVCNHPTFEGSRVRIMPDVHAGAGCVIGFTAELKTDKVIPNLIGVDIGCGAGWELVRLASESLCLLDDFKSRSRNLPYRFTIGAGDSLHAWVVAPVLASIQKRGLPWLFALENLRNSEIPSKLQNMDIDFGIVRTSALEAEGLESRVICSMDYALYVPAALAGKKARGKKEDFLRLLEMFPLATLGSGSGFHALLKRNCAEFGIRLRVHCETQSFPFAARMLKSGAFMAILPCMAEKELGEGFVKVTHPALDGLSRSISLAWNPRLLRVRPSAKRVIDVFSIPERE